MLAAIRGLPERTQRLLEVAACVRGRVDLWLLARLVAGRQEEIGADLWGAIREGLLVPDQAGLRFRDGEGRGLDRLLPVRARPRAGGGLFAAGRPPSASACTWPSASTCWRTPPPASSTSGCSRWSISSTWAPSSAPTRSSAPGSPA